MRTRILLIVGGLAMVFACLALVGLVGTAAQNATQRALAAADTDDTQHVTSICIGLINIGSCRTSQQSTSTPVEDGVSEGNPWPGVLLVVAMLCPMIFVAALTWRRSEEW